MSTSWSAPQAGDFLRSPSGRRGPAILYLGWGMSGYFLNQLCTVLADTPQLSAMVLAPRRVVGSCSSSSIIMTDFLTHGHTRPSDTARVGVVPSMTPNHFV